jgi:hypothetical protein
MAFLLPIHFGDFSVFLNADHKSVLLLTIFFFFGTLMCYLKVEKYVTWFEDLANMQLLF